jgi:hypothetical protein
VTSELGQAARRLLVGKPGEGSSSKEIAARAAQACERLAQHLSRLLGRAGVQMLLERSIVLASAELAWLGGARSGVRGAEDATSALRDAMERQDPQAISDGFVAILSAFVGLLDRLIGKVLVERLLHEVWPTVFVPAVKDTP